MKSAHWRHYWAVACFALGMISFFLLGPLLLSFTYWVDPWIYHLEYPVLNESQAMFWDDLRFLYLLGPEIVVALLALIASVITIAHWRDKPGWHQDEQWVTCGLTCAVVVLIIFGFLLYFGILLLAGKAL